MDIARCIVDNFEHYVVNFPAVKIGVGAELR